jgi:hypothetical protein
LKLLIPKIFAVIFYQEIMKMKNLFDELNSVYFHKILQ